MPKEWEDQMKEEEQANTPPKLVTVVIFDPDEADGYLGNENDGVYWQSAFLSQEEIDAHDESEWTPGWYLTVVVDCDSAGFVDNLVTDQGPYETDEFANSAGRTMAEDWCAENDARINEDEEH